MHGSLARSSNVGLVVTPWNNPRGRRASHSDVSPVSRKNRHSPRWGGVNPVIWFVVQHASSRKLIIVLRFMLLLLL